MAMGRTHLSPPPTNGIQSSSRFSTYTWGGKITNWAMVSHAEVWLLITMCAPAGIRSRPSTVNFKPQRRANTHSRQRAQLRATANWKPWGDQKHRDMNAPNTHAERIM